MTRARQRVNEEKATVGRALSWGRTCQAPFGTSTQAMPIWANGRKTVPVSSACSP